MSRVRVNISELIDCVREIQSDGYELAEMEIIEEETEDINELSISAVENESEVTIHYSNMKNIEETL